MSTPPATNSIETQIDSFLGQFKRTASKAKDKRPASDECFVDSLSGISTFTTAVNRSQSAKFDNNDATSTVRRTMALTNSMASVDAAEKEASEVLHSLLSVERIVKQEDNAVVTNQQQTNNTSSQNGTNTLNGTLQWQGNVAITTHSLFEDHFPQTIDEQQVHDVVWQGHTIQVGNGEIKFDAIPQILDEVQETEEPQQTIEQQQQQQQPTTIPVKKSKKIKVKIKNASKTMEKTKKKKPSSIVNWDPTKLEDNVAQVKERFKRGCECQDESCFRGLSAESVYKHRLNIAELTKGEHDMYLMGVTMACLANPDITVRHKERQRLRAQYVYQGRRVCLDAFLYLENCTHYQLKRIRKHVMTHGVAPRVHGNHGKKPHNTFSLDIYQHATEFLKQYLETTTGETNISNSKSPIQLPWDITRKNLHNAYKEYGQIIEPGVKLMGYSTFRHFLKELFPHVRFCKVEPKNNSQVVNNDLNKIQQSTVAHDQQQTTLKSVITGNEVQQVIPLVVSQTTADGSPAQQHQQATFLVAPVSQLISNGSNLVTMQSGGGTQHTGNTTTFPYQITNTGYVINEQGNIVTTMANQHQSYSFNHDVESIRSDCESRRSNNGTLVEEIAVRDVLNLLQSQYAIITGGKTKDMCPIITFPDNNNFQNITDVEYQRLMMYLTSVPSLQEADLGFHLIIDRRKDRWNSVKAVLLKISGYFPGIIHVAYVIRPASLLQKAISEVSNKLFKEEFKFRVIVCSRVEELHEYIDRSQLTQELGGFLKYSHHDWIQQRIELQKFSVMTKEISQALDIFLSSILETEFPNNVEATQQLLNQQGVLYAELKDEILSATKHGENLLLIIKENPASKCTEPTLTDNTDKLGNVFAVERLLVQLEETERTFDEFWHQHFSKLQQCLELRRFEQSFKELQSNFDTHLKTVSEMTEIGETVNRVDTLIQETTDFQKVCLYDIDRAEELVSTGQQLLQIKNSLSLDCIEPKCSELNRMCDILSERLTRRLDTLTKCRDLMERVEKANSWCTRGVELLASQHIEKCSTSTELAEKSLHEIQQFIASAAEFKLNSPKEFRYVFQDSITLETKALVMQVLQRIDDVSLMCDKRIANLKKLTIRSPRPVQTVTPERAMPLQPAGGAPPLCKGILRAGHHSINNLNRVESHDGLTSNHLNHLTSCDNDTDSRSARRGHTLSELLTTEQTYVEELYSILKGYKHELLNEEIKPLVPAILSDKIDILFGNLDELYNFHANIFLRELESCITSMDLVASCFVQQKDNFFRLYSSYCQNLTRSEQLREHLTSDAHALLQSLQRKLNHQLPLAAYLLKPVQRITKYQLLLKDLHRYSQDDPHAICDHQQLQEALNCMLLVLKCVNDSMLHVAITGYPNDLSQQGELLLQGSFSVWTESKKDLRLRLKTMQRHIFLYQKVILFCKSIAKSTHTKAMYQFKHSLKMSEIGLTESVKGDHKKFEIWLQGRQEVHTIQAATIEQKQEWVSKIKRVLFNQLEELKGEKIKQYSSLIHKPLRQTISWERQVSTTTSSSAACALPERTMSCDTALRSTPEETLESNVCWSSDYSNSEDEDPFVEQSSNMGSTTGSSITLNERISDMNRGKYVALADYNAIGHNEVSIKEGDIFELLKVGCAGWWFVRFASKDSTKEGWAPAAYLEPINGKKNRYRSQDALSD